MAATLKWVPVVDGERCTGCGRCAEACGPRCLEMELGFPLLTRATDCGSEEHCIGVCEDDAIRMVWVPMIGNLDRGKWSVRECAE